MITFKKNNITFKSFDIDIDDLKVNKLPFLLSKEVEIEDDVSFETIFNCIIENKDIFNTIFSSSMGGQDLDIFINEYNKSIDPNEIDKYCSDIEYLRISKATDVWTYKGEDEISIYGAIDGKSIKEDINYSIMFIPLNYLKLLNIKIDNTISFNKFENKKNVELLNGKTTITLFELFHTILHEISWFGSPENRVEKEKELEETSRKLKNGELETYEIDFDENGAYTIKDGKKEYFLDKNK